MSRRRRRTVADDANYARAVQDWEDRSVEQTALNDAATKRHEESVDRFRHYQALRRAGLTHDEAKWEAAPEEERQNAIQAKKGLTVNCPVCGEGVAKGSADDHAWGCTGDAPRKKTRQAAEEADGKVDRVVAMGFLREAAQKALRECEGDVEEALNMLLDEGADE
eukprot:Sspe_Gene.76897::Locus_48032_Transcript_1_1_Confidence_1.000_Length_640::g.76897::m.76897